MLVHPEQSLRHTTDGIYAYNNILEILFNKKTHFLIPPLLNVMYAQLCHLYNGTEFDQKH